MRKLKSILRLHFESRLSQHQIAASLHLSVGVVNKYVQRAEAAGLSWPLTAEYDDEELLHRCLQPVPKKTALTRHTIDFGCMHQEMKRKGVTAQLLWEEYKATTPTPMSYTNFCLLYRQWKARQPQSMRQTHKAGDKVFVDYAGPTIELIDLDSGEIRHAQLFVGVLGASNYTYAEASWTQQLPDWIASHRRMFEFFGGVPALVVCDNLKSAIQKACRYEPDINPTYADFIDYYGTAVLPARPYKPKDKAKVEGAVLIAERWIMARLRHRTFVGLVELNAAIRELLHALNQRPFKKLPGCRRHLFEHTDQPMLKPLPRYPYEYTHYKKARVHVDYHVELEGHYYSVPHTLIKKEMDIRFTHTRVECWYRGQCIAVHERRYKKGAHTTVTEHMPKAHRQHMQWTPGRFLNWASHIGPATTQFVKHLLTNRPHPEQGYRSCLGLLQLAKRFGETRLEKACERAWQYGAKTRRSVQSILMHRLENHMASEEYLTAVPLTHENLRGKNYYH